MSNNICWDCSNCLDEYDEKSGKIKYSCTMDNERQEQKEFPMVRAGKECFKRL